MVVLHSTQKLVTFSGSEIGQPGLVTTLLHLTIKKRFCQDWDSDPKLSGFAFGFPSSQVCLGSSNRGPFAIETIDSLPEFRGFILGKTILAANKKFRLSRPIHSGSETVVFFSRMVSPHPASHGPGKTLMAKALAGEAKVPFIQAISQPLVKSFV